jgi:hypothetical protein
MRTKTFPDGKKIKGITEFFSELSEKKVKGTKKQDPVEAAAALEEKKRLDELCNIKRQLGETRREITTISAQFNDASEPECIAYYAYLLKATEAKYDYLLRLARETAENKEIAE